MQRSLVNASKVLSFYLQGIRYATGVGVVYLFALSLRAIGRASNPVYREFLQVLNRAVKEPTLANKVTLAFTYSKIAHLLQPVTVDPYVTVKSLLSCFKQARTDLFKLFTTSPSGLQFLMVAGKKIDR